MAWFQIVTAFLFGMVAAVLVLTQTGWYPPRLSGPAPPPAEAAENPGDERVAVVVGIAGETTEDATAGSADAGSDEVAAYMSAGYKYGNKFKCDKSKLRHVVTPEEHARRRLASSTVDGLVETFRSCGVVALEGAIGAGDVAEFRANLEERLEPVLASRARVRDRFRATMRRRGSLGDLAAGTLDELFFQSGDVFKERNDGRIDIELPMADPFNRSGVTRNPFAVPLLRRLLGVGAELKSLHAMFALSYLNGTRDQHWHRDTGLLFAPDTAFHLHDVHARQDGVHEPPYAMNCFIALSNLSATDGPTEFILGSHMWGSTWYDDEQDDCCEDYMFTGMPPGSIVLSDYRTVHRGTINLGTRPRPLAMYIYGRDWWTDSVNYGRSDYGGLKATAADAVRGGVLSAAEAAAIPDDDLHLVAPALLRTHEIDRVSEQRALQAATMAAAAAAAAEDAAAGAGAENVGADAGDGDGDGDGAGQGAGGPAGREEKLALLDRLLRRWRVDAAARQVRTKALQKKMFKGMLAKWGESLQSEITGAVHQLPAQFSRQRAAGAAAAVAAAGSGEHGGGGDARGEL